MTNKKGASLPIQFLVTLVLAIIIFVPACYLGGKIFRTSDQAKDNYADFVENLNKFNEEKNIGDRGSTLLIMDEATAIVYFKNEKDKVTIDVTARSPYPDFSINLHKPGQCDNNKNCLCLFRKSEFEVEGTSTLGTTIQVKPKRAICTDLDYNLDVETCNIGEPEAVKSYTCIGGFMIERHLVDESSMQVASYFERPRRGLLYFVKLDNTVRIIADE
jgi:hypothetical protein